MYLGNYALSKAGLELEEIIHGKEAKKIQVEQYIFVTGLARSGTTAVMNKIFETGEYASLQYSNMPFVLNPNLWKRHSKIESHERAHKDGIIVDGNSPEEFDEYFWKAFLKDSYIKNNGLITHEVEELILDKYRTYVKLICLAKNKRKYISKNNNNVLRLKALAKIENQKTIILFRDPVSHASSLLKLHLRFSKEHKDDPFSLKYFDYLGHHEFGLHHKPFLLTETFDEQRGLYSTDSLNYWLAIWLNYYSYILNHFNKTYILIAFEDLISCPDLVYNKLVEKLGLMKKLTNYKKHKPAIYISMDHDEQLLGKCKDVYNKIAKLKAY
jgi:hypothetical protein